MTFFAQCSHCQTKFKAKPELAGKSVRCPKCKQVFTVQKVDAGPPAAGPERPPSTAKISNVGSKASASTEGQQKRATVANTGTGKTGTPAKRPPRWAGEPEPDPSDVGSPVASAAIAAGKESPILKSTRTISGVILPGHRHIPALEVPWGAPCNPPKDFLKERAGAAKLESPPPTSGKEHQPLLSPEEKEIRIEVSPASDDLSLVESEVVDAQADDLASGQASADFEQDVSGPDDSLIASESTAMPGSSAEFAGSKAIRGGMTDEVVTADNEGGFYRPALPGQHEDIYSHTPETLEKAMLGARNMLGRDSTFEELDAVEGTKYVLQTRKMLADEIGFGASLNPSKAGATKRLAGPWPLILMGSVAAVIGIVMLVTLVNLLGNIGTGGGEGLIQSDYVTNVTSRYPVEARGPAGLVTVHFPSNFEEAPTIQRPWLNARVDGSRLIREDDAFLFLYGSTIPGAPPTGNQAPTPEQLEVFGFQELFEGTDYIVNTKRLTLDDYPLLEYEFNVDILRMRPGRSRLALLYTQQRMFVFIWAGKGSPSSEVNKFFQSINVRGQAYPGST